MQIKTKILKFKTTQGPEFIDITKDVCEFVESTGVKQGVVNIFSQHTTAAIKINENEPLLIEDMTEFLKRLAPKEGNYNHNDFTRRTVNMCSGECANGHSHCLHLLLPSFESRPIIEGKVNLGIWQRVFLIELDHDRERQVLVQVMGEA
jgi:secondary thiamine-phosphate synthase enzyme